MGVSQAVLIRRWVSSDWDSHVTEAVVSSWDILQAGWLQWPETDDRTVSLSYAGSEMLLYRPYVLM